MAADFSTAVIVFNNIIVDFNQLNIMEDQPNEEIIIVKPKAKVKVRPSLWYSSR